MDEHTQSELPRDGRDERAVTIGPHGASADLVKVARAQNQAEAEFLQGLLRAEGVPSMLRRAPGYDVPDFLAAGPRDVLVPASVAQIAENVLLPADLGPAEPPPGQANSSRRVLVALLIGVALVAIAAWCITELFV
jgi:hypothetical protein